MERDLASFLACHTPRAEETEVWGSSPLRIASYLAGELPPLDYITSARALVFRDDTILVVRDPGRMHILPGGRREAGETPGETLAREVLEETGWALAGAVSLGFRHFHHLGPRPPGHRYPYPDFVQTVALAEAATFHPDAILPDEWVLGSAFQPIAEVRRLELSPGERLFLDAALARRAGPATPPTPGRL